MSTLVYVTGAEGLVDGSIDWETADIRALMTGPHTPDVDHDFVADVAPDELNDGGYARVTTSGRTISSDLVNNRVVLDLDNVTFPTLSSTDDPHYLILFVHTGNDATSRLIGVIDISTGGPTPTDGTDYVIEIDPDGAFWLYNTTPSVVSGGLSLGKWLALPSAHP